MSETATSVPASAASGDLALTSVISLVDELPILSGEEQDVCSEEQSEESILPPPEPITEDKLKEITYTLGLITLHWPEDAVINVEEYQHFTQNYAMSIETTASVEVQRYVRSLDHAGQHLEVLLYLSIMANEKTAEGETIILG